MSILRDVDSAQDATQQALIAAYSSLHTLQDPEKFASWLTGIVRHECLRIIRRRTAPIAPLHAAEHIPSHEQGPERYVEAGEMQQDVMLAIDALPPREREVTVLYYIRDFSQREVAASLGIPVTTVNNRLHAARQRLRTLLTPSEPIISAGERRHLTRRVGREAGRIVRVAGPVVDVRHEPNQRPLIFDRLVVYAAGSGRERHLLVTQTLDEHTARCFALDSLPGTAPHSVGSRVTRASQQPGRALEPGVLRTVINAAGGSARGSNNRILETGIKAIDLMCPLPVGGSVAFFGGPGIGKLVLVEELVRTLSVRKQCLTIFAFIGAHHEATLLQKLQDSGTDISTSSSTVQVVYLPFAESQAHVSASSAGWFDAIVCLSNNLAQRKVFPAIDALASSSRMLDPDIVGEKHYAVATTIKRMISRRTRLSSQFKQLDEQQQLMDKRVERIENFFSQPLFISEDLLQQPGCFVSRDEAVESFSRLLTATYDMAPPENFLYQGLIRPESSLFQHYS